MLAKLAKLKQDLPEQKALCFPAGGQSLSYSRGDSLTVCEAEIEQDDETLVHALATFALVDA